MNQFDLGLLNSIYFHIRWSKHENWLIVDQHSSQQAASEHYWSPFDRLSVWWSTTPPNGRSAEEAVRSTEKRPYWRCSPARSYRWRRVAAPGWRRLVRGELYVVRCQWPRDGDSTSSHPLPSSSLCSHSACRRTRSGLGNVLAPALQW